jgi:hypothetical protein
VRDTTGGGGGVFSRMYEAGYDAGI